MAELTEVRQFVEDYGVETILNALAIICDEQARTPEPGSKLWADLAQHFRRLRSTPLVARLSEQHKRKNLPR